MNRHGTPEAAAITGPPLWEPRALSRARPTVPPQERSAEPEASALPGTPAGQILEELDVVLAKSHRGSGLQRLLRRVRSAFVKW
jgi:hypothetical protein